MDKYCRNSERCYMALRKESIDLLYLIDVIE